MTVDLTKEEIAFILKALNAVNIQGLDTMQAVLSMADKLNKALLPEPKVPE